jgi:hypothetical protein
MSTTYTNLFTNPQPATATPGWSITVGTGGVAPATLITDAAGPAGNLARRATWTTGSTGGVSGQIFGAGIVIPGTGSTVYSMACYIRLSAAKNVTPRIQWVDAASASLLQDTGPSVAVPADTWTLIKYEGRTSHADTAWIRGSVVSPSGEGWETGFVQDMQAGTIIQGATIPEAFHGDMTDTGTKTYSWVGTADQSNSTLVVDDAPVLSAPTWATPGVSTITSTQSDLDWDPVSGATGYDIERDGSIIVMNHATTAYSDMSGGPGKVYRVRAAAV